ncbi:MAG: hypothetical protein EOP51_24130 [Sphingobacteriales bacterium]|nr:MAG: hypothetical protein EOP51_24130 [Sphingobacteriales bacterium]
MGLLTLCFLLTAVAAYAQVTKFKTSGGSVKFYNKTAQSWKPWEALENASDILITLDPDADRIKIFSSSEQVFDIIKFYDVVEDSDGDEVIPFQCVDQDGRKCKLRFMILHSQNKRKQLYVDYSDMMVMYNIYNL